MKPVKLIFVFLFAALLIGCANTVPVTKFVNFEEPKKSRIAKKILVVIDDRLQEKKIEHKPINVPGMASYEFSVGESLKYTVMGGLRQRFSSVDLSNSISGSHNHEHDYIVVCSLDSAHIDMGASIFSKHSADIAIRFVVLNNSNNKIFETVETGNSESKMTSGEIAYQLVPMELWSQKNSYGASAARAWDMAVLQAVDRFVEHLSAIR